MEKAILIGLNAKSIRAQEVCDEVTLKELEALLETAGGECVGKMIQNRQTVCAKTFIGEGKVLEVKELAEANDADMIIFDNELSPSQTRVLEEMTEKIVLDRSALILDIFAKRANTAEGKLQVELAQYKYILPRLSGMGIVLSRQQGGIGSRGPGESKLETDRRHIRTRIERLEREIEGVRKNRALQRRQREKSEMPLVCIVGYTNAGKSTLLNTLTDAGIPANDRLFDTLDTTTKKLKISDTLEVFINDTVGFIRKLPHHLIRAFKATLEELKFADVLLHVIDVSDENYELKKEVVENVIKDIGAEHIPIINLYNKADMTDKNLGIMISAKNGQGIDEIFNAISQTLSLNKHVLEVLLPYDKGYITELIHKDGKIISEDHTELGTAIKVECDDKLFGRIKEFAVE